MEGRQCPSTAGSRQPLLVRDAHSAKSARYAMHTRTSAGAAGVSPPWYRETRCNGDSLLRTDYVCSARSVGAPRLAYASRSWSQTRMLVLLCISYARVRCSSHGWLTPAALGARRRFGEKCAICNAHTNVRKSGGREPAVGCDTNALLRELSTVRQSANTKPGAAGVSPPCARSVERCLRFVADHLQVRSPTHGWLTPAALGRRRGCFCRCAFHTRGYPVHRTAGLRQPLLVGASWLYKGDGYCQGVAVRQAALTFAIC